MKEYLSRLYIRFRLVFHSSRMVLFRDALFFTFILSAVGVLYFCAWAAVSSYDVVSDYHLFYFGKGIFFSLFCFYFLFPSRLILFVLNIVFIVVYFFFIVVCMYFFELLGVY